MRSHKATQTLRFHPKVKLLAKPPNNLDAMRKWKIRECLGLECELVGFGPTSAVKRFTYCSHGCAKRKPESQLSASGKRVREWREDNPQRYENTLAVQRARAKGIISAPSECRSCKYDENIVYKHSDTFNPLNIEPICRSCLKLGESKLN